MIVPIFTYGSLALYGSTPQHIKSKIEKIDDKIRFIIGNNESIPETEDIRNKQLCIFVHTCLHNDDICCEFKEYFEIRSTSAYTTCNGMKIEIPRIKLEAARKATYFQGAIVFNELPEHIRKETDFRDFETQLH